jgi:hypothetical protein
MKADRRVRVVDVLRLDRTGACDIDLAAQHTDDNRPAERQARAPPFPNSSRNYSDRRRGCGGSAPRPRPGGSGPCGSGRARSARPGQSGASSSTSRHAVRRYRSRPCDGPGPRSTSGTRCRPDCGEVRAAKSRPQQRDRRSPLPHSHNRGSATASLTFPPLTIGERSFPQSPVTPSTQERRGEGETGRGRLTAGR